MSDKKNDSAWSIKKRIYYNIISCWIWMTHFRNYGTNIYSKDWDLLVVLDGCRVDAMKKVSSEYDFIQRVDKITSTGSLTTEWMGRTFTNSYREQILKTAYICANPHTETSFRNKSILTNDPPVFFPFPEADTVDPNDFAHFEEIWRTEYDSGVGVTPPRPVTDSTIRYGRKNDFDQLVVHYMQPHEPLIAPNATVKNDFDSKTVWNAVKNGEKSESTVWNAYLENLRYVLDDVSLLLENIDAETVVITADHGNAMGEMGVWGHPVGWLQSEVRCVPWVETSASDTGTHTPSSSVVESQTDIEEQLESLGYL